MLKDQQNVKIQNKRILMVAEMKMMNLNITIRMLIQMASELLNLQILEEQVDQDVKLLILILEDGLKMIQIMKLVILVILKYLLMMTRWVLQILVSSMMHLLEIVNGGQQRYLNRFQINFNNNGVVSSSYIRNNSIHNSNARCIGLQSVSHLEVTDNICYNIVDHAIYIQNANEMHNTFEHNLVAVVKSSWQLYQSDATVADFWITNPKNKFLNNRVGGPEWYGFYLAFKSNPSGVALTSDFCPTGVPLLNFTNNAAHSTGRIGLRIGTLIPKFAPCVSHRDDALDDPFTANPSVQTKLSGFITWANAQVVVLVDNLGNVIIENVLIASSKISGYQQHNTNFSAEGTTIRNFVIVDSQTNTGLIVPIIIWFWQQEERINTLKELRFQILQVQELFIGTISEEKSFRIQMVIQLIYQLVLKLLHINCIWMV